MWVIWQELKAIIADGWDWAVSGMQKLTVLMRQLRTFIAENYPSLIVLAVGSGISIPLFMYGVIGGFSAFLAPFVSFPVLDLNAPPAFGPGLVGSILCCVAGCGLMVFTVELLTRIDKRLEGKPKGDDQSQDEA